MRNTSISSLTSGICQCDLCCRTYASVHTQLESGMLSSCKEPATFKLGLTSNCVDQVQMAWWQWLCQALEFRLSPILGKAIKKAGTVLQVTIKHLINSCCQLQLGEQQAFLDTWGTSGTSGSWTWDWLHGSLPCQRWEGAATLLYDAYTLPASCMKPSFRHDQCNVGIATKLYMKVNQF